MKRILAAVLMCGAGSCIAAGAAPTKKSAPVSAADLKAQSERRAKAQADALARMAPADEYFGPLKLSLIGISNTIRDIGLRYKYNHDLAPQSLASARLTESAIRDWYKRYPHDPQLPRNVFFLQRLYSQILLQESRDRANSLAQLMFSNFASSPQARQLKKTLAVEHLEPLPSPSPTPEPSASPVATDTPPAVPGAPIASPGFGSPAPIPSGSIAPVPSPATSGASPAPRASASAPAPTASPTAAGSAIPGATPSPQASPVPSVPAASPAPAAGSPVPTSVATSAPGASPAPTPAASPR